MSLSKVYDEAGELVQVVNKFHLFTDVLSMIHIFLHIHIIDIPPPQLDLRDPKKNDLSNFQLNGEFHLESFTSKYHLVNYSCCEEPYPDITYTIRMRRRPMFYVFNLILPCVLINGIG